MEKEKVVGFERIAREVFSPVYPVIAQEIMNTLGIKTGTCLDLGAGPGYLGLALADLSDLDVILFDISPEMLAYANRNIRDRSLGSRVRTLCGDVHNIPLPDQSVDLVVSRGSVFFWKDLRKAFQEIYRILAPGGLTFVGGGFGSTELKKQIDEKMRQRDPEWIQKTKERLKNFSSGNYGEILNELNISYTVKKDTGFWIMIRK